MERTSRQTMTTGSDNRVLCRLTMNRQSDREERKIHVDKRRERRDGVIRGSKRVADGERCRDREKEG